MPPRVILVINILNIFALPAWTQWADISDVNVKQEPTELAGLRLVIEYKLNEKNVSPLHPVYVFVRYSTDFGETWTLLPLEVLRGNGFDIVEKSGPKKIFWWGTTQTSFPDPARAEFRVRGIPLAQVPAGRFTMKTIPGQGRDEAREQKPATTLPTFYLARCETTIGMYVDYLNEIGSEGMGWNDKMTHPDRCGIIRNPDQTYKAKPGRENYPVTYTSWYDATGFVRWCGLRLPTEAEWEKALRGGHFLDGDKTAKKPNPAPQRPYPWGDEAPDAGGIYRCNFDGPDDGFEYTAPVGSFSRFNSPYGICDLSGNVAELTLDWYTTSYHVGLDGFRVVRGGSWMAVPVACDAITGATQFPLKESSIMGFRAAR